MGLDAARECMNCHEYTFSIKELAGNEVEASEDRRGDVIVPVECEVCGAMMAFVWYDDRPRKGWYIGFYHTVNDEPCYDPECEQCAGTDTDAGWWADIK